MCTGSHCAKNVLSWLLKFLGLTFNDDIDCYDYTASMKDVCMSMEHWWNDTNKGQYKHSDRIRPSASLAAPGLRLNRRLQNQETATKHLSHGTYLDASHMKHLHSVINYTKHKNLLRLSSSIEV
jgi:hypothetical protein